MLVRVVSARASTKDATAHVTTSAAPLPRDSIVGAIIRGTHASVPRGTDRLQADDRLLVFTTRAGADDVRLFFSKAT